MTKSKKNPRQLTESYLHQISVLRVLCQNSSDGPTKATAIVRENSVQEKAAKGRPFDINEISELSGVRDEKEIQRYLYILEGHKLVSPFPAGDFTSKSWHITDDGVKAFASITTEYLG